MKNDTALLLVDFQNDYYPSYPGAKWKLVDTEQKSALAAKLLKKFREQGRPVVHVRHEFESVNAPFFLPQSEGAKIHDSVAPIAGEHVVLKHKINSFRETDLGEAFANRNVKKVVIVGAMSHMCIDGAARAAVDFGYETTVIDDCCATLDLEFKGKRVPAEDVHHAIMAALKFGYCDVMDYEEYSKKLEADEPKDLTPRSAQRKDVRDKLQGRK